MISVLCRDVVLLPSDEFDVLEDELVQAAPETDSALVEIDAIVWSARQVNVQTTRALTRNSSVSANTQSGKDRTGGSKAEA